MSLTIRDRMNFPYLLANQILTIQKAMLNSSDNSEISRREIEEAMQGFVQLIPEVWRDEEFYKEYESAKVIVTHDKRPIVAGKIRLAESVCKELGIEPYEQEETYDPYKLFHICINLLERRGMVSRQTYTEKIPSKKRSPNVQVDP